MENINLSNRNNPDFNEEKINIDYKPILEDNPVSFLLEESEEPEEELEEEITEEDYKYILEDYKYILEDNPVIFYSINVDDSEPEIKNKLI